MDATGTVTPITDDGGWCWFQDPRAVRYEGDRDRTYVGWITRAGDIEVGQYDHDRERVTARTTLHADYEPDDHDAPVFAVRPDGRLVVFYTRHAGSAVNYRIADDPESVASFGPERSIEPGAETAVTYPNPRWIDGDLHLFLRNSGSVVEVVSPDGGETWSDQRELVTTGGEGWCVYAKVSRSWDGEVHFGFTHAIGNADHPHLHVCHARYDGDALRRSDGGPLGRVSEGSLPVSVYETTRVFDSAATGDGAWIWDCSTAGGVPQVVYARFAADDDHRYRYARWDGDRWLDEPLCRGGASIADADSDEGYYSPGVVLDHDEPGVCYAAVGDHDGSELLRLERDDGEWRRARVAGDDDQHVRPVVPWNRRSDLGVCWLRGRYDHYEPRSGEEAAAYRTEVVGADTG